MPRKDTDPLARLSVASPCPADWDSMIGNDRVRFCSHCNLSVHHLSEMTRTEALALVRKSQGRLCVRYYSRPDGTIQIAAQKLHTIKRRASRLAAGAFSATLSLCSTVAAQTPSTLEPSAADGISIVNPYDTARPQQKDGPAAALTGTIVDPHGAAVPGIPINLVNEQTRSEQASVSDSYGSFSFHAVPPGKYRLKIEAYMGFAATEIEDIQLAAGEERHIDTTLEIVETVTMGIVAISEPSNPLVNAVFKNDLTGVRELIAMGADVNVTDENLDATPLMQAVANGNHAIVRTLLDAGANVNERNGGGVTALMMMRNETSVEIVWTLLSAGAKVNRRDELGNSPLIHAALQSNTPVLQALIDAGAKVNMKDKGGKTALMWAAEMGYIENVGVLLKAGADVNRKSEDNKTALSLAQGEGQDEVVKLLEAYGARE